MQSIDESLAALGGATGPKEYRFYNGEVSVFYDDDEHSYVRYDPTGRVLISGVTTVAKVSEIDKADALTNWAARMTVEYVRHNLDLTKTYTADELEGLLMAAQRNFRDYKEDAGEVGHQAHGWLEQYIRADKRNDHERLQFLLAAMPQDERAKNGATAALHFMQRHKVRWLFAERKIYSKIYDYAGTMDGLGYVSSCGDRECSCCGYVDLADGVRKVREFTDVLSVIDWKTSNRLYENYHYQTAAYLWAHAEEFPDQRAQLRFVTRLGKEDAQFEAKLLTEETFELDFQVFVQCLYVFKSLERKKQLNVAEKAAIKAAEKAKREAELKIACAKSAEFKGTRYPKCNDGPPCETCLAKHEQYLLDKAAKEQEKLRAKAEKTTKRKEKAVLGTVVLPEPDGRDREVLAETVCAQVSQLSVPETSQPIQ